MALGAFVELLAEVAVLKGNVSNVQADAAVGAADAAELNEGNGRDEEEDCGHRGLEKIEEGDPCDEEEENSDTTAPPEADEWANRSQTKFTVACGLRQVVR